MKLTVSRGVLSLFLLTGLIYANGLGGAFLWDDEYFLLDSPYLMKETVWSAFSSDLWGHTQRADTTNQYRYFGYRPLARLSYSWLVRIFGQQPFRIHLASLLAHAGAGMLVFLLVLEFAPISVAWLAAALFVAHPLHVEAVAWMSAFSEVLAGALMLLSLYALVRARRWSQVSSPRSQVSRLGTWDLGPGTLLTISYTAAALAFLTKETALVLPVMAALFVGWRAWPFFPIAGGTMLLRFSVMGLATGPIRHIPAFEQMGIVLATAVQYAKKMVWPWPLAPEYNVVHSPATWVAFAGACGLAAWAALRRPRVRLALLLIIVPLAPALASSLIEPPLSFMRDRNAYVAILGFALLVAQLAQVREGRLGARASSPVQSDTCGRGYAGGDARAPGRRAGAMAALVLLLAWSAVSVATIRHWSDLETLWTHTLSVTPNSRTAALYLGTWYFETQRFAEAQRVCDQGLSWRPKDGDLLYLRAAIRKQLPAAGSATKRQ